jgi:hypothetical protein
MAFIGMRSMAGFAPNVDYYLPRGRCEPDECLQRQIFPWADEELEAISESFASGDAGRSTARGFLSYLVHSRRIILQDAAAMIVEDESRREHPLFQLQVFQTAEFSAFVERMRTKLGESSLEREARGQIEKALRGVNARFDNLESKQQQKFEDLEYKLQQRDSRLVLDFSKAVRESIGDALSENFSLAANAIATRGSSRGALTVETFTQQQAVSSEADRGAAASSEEADAPACFGHKVLMGYSPANSIFEVYNEYYGIEEFNGKPIEGGLHAMEQQYGIKWRKVGTYWTSAEQKHFSRIKCIIAGVENAVAQGQEKLVVLRMLQHIYQGDRTKRGTNLAGCVTYLQEQGYLEKKARNKRSREE